MLFNKPKMMIADVKFKLALIDEHVKNLEADGFNSGEIYECYIAQRVILKEVLHEMEMIDKGKAIVKEQS